MCEPVDPFREQRSRLKDAAKAAFKRRVLGLAVVIGLLVGITYLAASFEASYEHERAIAEGQRSAGSQSQILSRHVWAGGLAGLTIAFPIAALFVPNIYLGDQAIGRARVALGLAETCTNEGDGHDHLEDFERALAPFAPAIEKRAPGSVSSR